MAWPGLVPGELVNALHSRVIPDNLQWSNGRVIALLNLTGVLLVGFCAVQVFIPRTATLPPRIFKQRNTVATFWTTLTINCGNYIISMSPAIHL